MDSHADAEWSGESMSTTTSDLSSKLEDLSLGSLSPPLSTPRDNNNNRSTDRIDARRLIEAIELYNDKTFPLVQMYTELIYKMSASSPPQTLPVPCDDSVTPAFCKRMKVVYAKKLNSAMELIEDAIDDEIWDMEHKLTLEAQRLHRRQYEALAERNECMIKSQDAQNCAVNKADVADQVLARSFKNRRQRMLNRAIALNMYKSANMLQKLADDWRKEAEQMDALQWVIKCELLEEDRERRLEVKKKANEKIAQLTCVKLEVQRTKEELLSEFNSAINETFDK